MAGHRKKRAEAVDPLRFGPAQHDFAPALSTEPAQREFVPGARLFVITPLDYIRAGEDRRLMGTMGKADESPESLLGCVMEYLGFMKDRTLDYTKVAARGQSSTETVSFPLLPETFRLFASLPKTREDQLRQDPDFADAWSLFDDAVASQQFDGVLMGLYSSKSLAVVKDKATKIEVTGEVSAALEPIIGMEVK